MSTLVLKNLSLHFMKLLSIAVGLIFFIGTKTTAQSQLPVFGQITPEDINIKECTFDREAEAVIIFDEAGTDYDDDYSMITRRRVRIKILTDKGLERGNVIIPFYSGDNFEFIREIKGLTSNTDASGNIIQSSLDKKSIYIEKKNNYYSLVKFAMPSVKAGSILEYSYQSVMKHYGGLE